MVFDMLCSLDHTNKSITLKHHIFSPDSGLERKDSKLHHVLSIVARIENNDYSHFGCSPPKYHRTIFWH